MKCPDCNGDGGGDAFVNRGPDISTHSVEWIRCRTCDGSGAIDDARAALIAQGKKWRDNRVAHQQSLLEASRHYSMGPAELSAIECGRAPIEAYDRLRALIKRDDTQRRAERFASQQ